MSAIDTTWLSHARFEPKAPYRVRQRQLAAGALSLLLLGAGYALFGDALMKARDVAAMRSERETLAARVERLQTELAVEGATRRELEQQAAALNAQVEELNKQLQFLKARKAPKSAEPLN